MRDRERGDDQDERSQSPERNDQTKQEQQMIGAVENVVKPDCTNRSAAWCQRGSSRTLPGSPTNSNARTTPSGGMNRITVVTLSPSLSTTGAIEKSDRSD